MRTLDGDDPDLLCITDVDFSDLERLTKGVERHAEELMDDVPNYTNIQPEVEISEIVGQG